MVPADLRTMLYFEFEAGHAEHLLCVEGTWALGYGCRFLVQGCINGSKSQFYSEKKDLGLFNYHVCFAMLDNIFYSLVT
jgi:hypothetical protein